ncbi:hypothetical protein [Marinobacter nauticus]|nr:hypothetical protein [Marinobacter nauticus]
MMMSLKDLGRVDRFSFGWPSRQPIFMGLSPAKTKECILIRKMALSSVVLLAACGGGGSGSGGNNDGGGGVGLDARAEGAFMDARVEGVAYPAVSSASMAAGQYGVACSGEHHYFETDDGRIRVYGSTAFSETDFEVVAGMVAQRLDGALTKFGLNWGEFVAQRPLVNLDKLASVVENHHYYQQEPDFFLDSIAAQTYVPGYPGYDLDPEGSWQAWALLDDDERIAFLEDIYVPMEGVMAAMDPAAPEPITINDVLIPKDKLVVCLNDSMGGNQFGEGSQFGIQVPPHTSSYHSKVGEIFTHELIHFIQNNIANAGQNPYGIMPRWFSEGQAVYFAGQSIASAGHHYTVNPVKILGFYDELDSGVDPSTAYEHYGLAYKYIHEANGRDVVVDMMRAMKTNTDTPHQWQSAGVDAFGQYPEFDEGLAFTRAFSDHIKDHTGAAMTIEQYRTGYHEYMNSWR